MKKIKIKSIEKLNGPNDRYDLVIPKNHNFFANGILIHNSSGRTGYVRVKHPGFIPQLIMKTERASFIKKIGEEIKNIKKNERYRIFRKYAFQIVEALTPKVPNNIIKKVDKTINYIMNVGSKFQWDYISGTRNIVLDPQEITDKGYYGGSTFRIDINDHFKRIGLRKGETIYYEIVGYSETGKSIQGAHVWDETKEKDPTLRKEIKKMAEKYGGEMFYSYGTDPEDPTKKKYEIYIYRITMTNETGDSIDLSWSQVLKRCEELGLSPVKTLFGPIKLNDIYHYLDKGAWEIKNEKRTSGQILVDKCAEFTEGSSTFDNKHIIEGVAIRVEHPKMFTILKYKGFWFSLLEAHKKNNKNYIDIEEIN